MWKVLTAAVLVALLVWEPRSFPVGLGGAACGLLAALTALQVGQVLGALLFRVRVSLLVIGVGGELRTWNGPRRRVVLRSVPLLMTVGLTSVRAPVRPRLWLTALVSVLLTALLVAASWLPGGPFWRGFAVAGTAVLVNALVPRRGAGTTSPGWFLFALPRLTGRPVAELEATPMVNEVSDALNAGELDTAERVAEQLLREHPDLLVAIGSRIGVLTLRGRYAEALRAVSALAGRTDLDQRDMAFVMAEMASSAANAVEAGQVPAEVGLPAAQRAAEGALQLGYPTHRFAGTLAQLALLGGDPARAEELARQAASASESGLSRADALATVARAQMASGDNAAARRTLVEAVELAGWSPRVAETNARLTID
ncbi:Tfp pilus assembly protein PilF [Saccharothrix coeruleofusca]|uniref:tetratricopeptide repeat protein n=1 Tax=Saccharothrix coeruleofusca TaxID=33919 RepID=UPI001AE44A09|nr:hypothetical protein [Saccharothrix coeruleofusca]MBP2338689.1 Tfp pilus assembly protein PilF [Saccharothrix coeruleofusca]